MDYKSVFENVFGFRDIKWKSNGEGIGRCPDPMHEDRNPSCSFNADKGLIYCHSCGYSKNAYTYAKEDNYDNPRQYIKDYQSYEYKPNNTLKSRNRDQSQTINETKEVYWGLLPSELKEDSEFWGKDYGISKNGRVTFHYGTAIKHHKGITKDDYPFWDKRSIDKSCQIFGLNRVDLSKPIIIFEGEPDVVVVKSWFNAISFSHGAGKVPDDLSALKDIPEIIVLGDNDNAGIKHNEVVAHRFHLMGIKASITSWDKSLPESYDPKDDWKANKNFDETQKAIDNAVVYEPSKEQIETDNKIGDFDFMDSKIALATEVGETEWFVEDILPKGYNCMLAGTAGSKKSYYSMQLGMSLANGEKNFCGGKIDKQYKVLYVDTEVGKNELIKRFRNILNQMDWRGDDYWRMLTKKGRMIDIWENVHRAVDRFTPDLLIIDCLWNSTSINDFSKGNQMAKVTDALSDFNAIRGISVLAVHHFVKGNHEVIHIDRVVGSSALAYWIEFCILMVKTNRDNMNLWKVGKARGVPHNEYTYALKWENFMFRADGIVDDITPFMIDKHAKNKYASIIEDLPEKFDTKDWLNIFSQQHPSLSDRTGQEWLRKSKDAQMIKRLSQGLYQKHLRLINEENIDN